jgi:hypothetical protein
LPDTSFGHRAKQYVTHQFTQAPVFLTWLHESRIAPREVTQAP